MSIPDVEDISSPVDIINMSLGGNDANGCSDALQEAVDYAYAQGINVVVSAGNSTLDAENFTTSCDNLLNVGAHTASGEMTSFSNFGELIDVSMLGSGVYTAFVNSNIYEQDANNAACVKEDGTLAGTDGCYGTVSGTSISAPLVAAMVAQIKLVKPELNPAEIMAIVKTTAVKYDENESGQETARKTLFPNAGAGNAMNAVASTFSSAQIEVGHVAHQFAHIINADQELYLDAMVDVIGKETACNSYQASFGYFDSPVATVHYEIYQSNTQDSELTPSNAEYLVPVGGGVLEYPSATVNMQGTTRLGVRACKDGSCGDIFELDLASAQKPTYCL
jgi:serine protease